MSGWVHRVIDDEVLLAGPDREPKSVAGLATAVWVVLDRPATAAEIEQRIAGRWPQRPVDRAAVAEALRILHHVDLVERTKTLSDQRSIVTDRPPSDADR